MAWWRDLRLSAALLAVTTTMLFAAAAEGREPVIRTSADGAGPSHLFWLTGPPAGQAGTDVIGVVDPLYAAVRFYRITRPAASDAILTGRVERLGACGLPIDFRPWRLHQIKTGVLLESMPNPGEAGHLATASALLTKRYRIDRGIVAAGGLIDAEQLETAGWNPAAKPCGSYDGVARPVRTDQSYAARRDDKHPARTIILTNRQSALAQREPLSVTSSDDGLYRLVAAAELEPAGNRRVVQVVEALPGADGVLRLRQSLLSYVGGKLVGTRRFDETLIRSKMGQKPVAVMPTGEVIVMGAVETGHDHDKIFVLLSCGSLIGSESGRKARILPCQEDAGATSRNIVGAVSVPQPPQIAEPSAGADRSAGDDKAIFRRTREVREAAWSVDTANLPDRCRVPGGCLVGPPGHQGNYVAVRGLRLTRGVYRQATMAYAQTTDAEIDVPAFMAKTQADWDASLRAIDDPTSRTPGNLDDHFEADLGIDCSALVQLAWSGLSGSRLSTLRLQTKPPGYVCPDRLPNLNSLKPGDALAINVKHGPNHVVLLGAAFALDGASDSWLVLESASGCDGVCWSVYDPSFFNGWGLYRASKRSDVGCPPPRPETSITSSPLPQDLDAWRRIVLTSGGS